MIKLNFRKKENGVPILSRKEIENIAESILMDYDPSILSSPKALDIEDMAENYLNLIMDYQDISKDKNILGMTVFNDCYVPVYDMENKEYVKIFSREGTIIIDNSLLSYNQARRGRFTLGHEIGHWLLHKHKYSYNSNQICFFDDDLHHKEPLIKCRTQYIEIDSSFVKKLKTDKDWIEWQADNLSASLLMPRATFCDVANSKFIEHGLVEKRYAYGVDTKVDLCINTIIKELSDIFDVSLKSTKIRLKELGFIRDGLEQQQSFIF